MELVPAGVVTVTSTVPDPAGDVAVICVELTTMMFVAALDPNRTAVAPVRFVPVIVTPVPPEVGPEAGLIPVTLGGWGGPWYGLDVAVVVSDVVCTVSADDVETFEGFVTPLRLIVTWSPGFTALPEAIVQTWTVWELTPQVPTCTPASVTTAFVIVRVLDVAGRVIVIWLCAVPVIPPVPDVSKRIV